MPRIKNIQIRASYVVGFGDIDVPETIFKELEELHHERRAVDGSTTNYEAAVNWLNDNVDEIDAFDGDYEIEIFY